MCCVAVFLGVFFFKQDTYVKHLYFLQTSLPCKMAAWLDGCQPFIFNHWCRVLARATSFFLVQLGPSWPPPPPWPPPTTTTTRTTTAKTKANNITNYHNQWSFQQGNLQEQHMFSPLLSVWIISLPFLSIIKSPHRIHHVLRHHACEHQISHVMPQRHPQQKSCFLQDACRKSLRQAIMCQRTTLRLL